MCLLSSAGRLAVLKGCVVVFCIVPDADGLGEVQHIDDHRVPYMYQKLVNLTIQLFAFGLR